MAGGGAAVLRKLYRAATSSYDGTQYKGEIVQAITPNEQFYCVTKNVIDPVVQESVWRLEINGLVETPQHYNINQLKKLPAVTQETTLMCISNGLDAGLMSNAVWKGVPMKTLLSAATPRAEAAKVRAARSGQLHRHDPAGEGARSHHARGLKDEWGAPAGSPWISGARDCARLLRREAREVDYAD